jgi:hypothetical protein
VLTITANLEVESAGKRRKKKGAIGVDLREV